ncbi:class 1 fructose-bisphosphatase [Acidocella sp.]|jgi:fructose-1,6-bisphosphatase I|uniref:class 1 fructose-bisphosphatase n=1 Tax=Acidocella sp. TaxID=50710 RepID=UPI002F3FE4D5
MTPRKQLDETLTAWAATDPLKDAVAATILCLADAAAKISRLLAAGPLAGDLGAVLSSGEAGEEQKALDVQADAIFLSCLRPAPVAAIASEEAEHAVLLDPAAPLLVALDPLDGSSNIETGLSVGSIFSILPRCTSAAIEHEFLRPGTAQLAAGYVLYGPHTALVLSVGEGTDLYVLEPESRVFLLAQAGLKIPAGKAEFAINMSNYRHWDEGIRLYIDDCLSGQDGPRKIDFNMRWLACLVAEAHRIFSRGGIYLYPADARKGYGSGRLRLIYEASPIAMLVQNAGGLATDGATPILEKIPAKLHQRTPLVFGAHAKVERLASYLRTQGGPGEHAPLFRRRTLFSA